MQRALVIFQREWNEMTKNKTLLQTMSVLPLLLVLVPTGLIIFVSIVVLEYGNANKIPEYAETLGPLTGENNTKLLAGLITICFSLFLSVPSVLPMTIAAYSVVNEKDKKSLEPLLVTPITTPELLWGKSLSAIIPSTIICWASFTALVVIVSFVTNSAVVAALDLAIWFAIIGLWTPLMAAWGTLIGVSISSRAKDARAATQVGSLMVLPVVGLIFAINFKLITVNWAIFGIGVLVWMAIVSLSYSVALKVFQRENILTRWK